jgi:hypothetical protein
VLEAVAFSPVRTLVAPTTPPRTITDDLKATALRLGPALPQVAALLGVEVPPNAPKPKPLRQQPPRRNEKGKPAAKGKPANQPKPAKATDKPADQSQADKPEIEPETVDDPDEPVDNRRRGDPDRQRRGDPAEDRDGREDRHSPTD